MSSPIKRRALAPVDGNLPTPAKTPVKPVDEAQSVSGTAAAAACSSSPIKPRGLQMTPPASSSPRKRAATPDDSPRKRACPDTPAQTHAVQTHASPAGPTMTRQQAREKAEILRLRLGLAGYKVRTGQTTVPLDELVRKPLPGIGASAAGRDDEAEADRHSPERGAADLLCLARGSSE